MSDEPQDDLELEAWEPQAPPGDFAQRVLAEIASESASAKVSTGTGTRTGRARRWGVGVGVVGVLALAAAMAVRVNGAPDHGAAIAKDRMEVSLGSRAKAVLEPGADVAWDGDDVVQAHGDVFYRVERGARFRVHTPAGDVEVKGTCFAVKVRGEGQSSESEGGAMNKRDVKSGMVGAALSALAFVAVYEGKVAVSHASERVDLAAGESARAGASGVARTGSVGEGERSFDAKVAEGEEPLSKANENLVSQVSEYRRRLEAITAQKVELEQTLKNTEQKLASKGGDASAARSRSEFDLGADDWKELAKDGTIKYMMPCSREATWTPSPATLEKLALSPDDGPVLHDAYARAHDRMWGVIKPLCTKAVGGSTEIAERIGLDTCIHLVLDEASSGKGRDAAGEAMRQVGEIRAGLRPMPAANEQTNPVLKMFLDLTGETRSFENDLAQSFGPEEAHRITYADGMCMGQSTFGGRGPRDAAKK